VISEKVMTQILDPKICSKHLYNKICRYYAKRLEKQEGGLSQSWFFLWRGFIASWEKKLKIATLTEAPFMVKLDFWKNKYFFFKYLRNNFWGKYLKLSQTFNLTLFLPSSNEELCILSPKIWNIWTLIKWGTQLKNLSEIFGGR